MRTIVPNHARPVWAEISAGRLAHNFRALKDAAGSDLEMLAIVKADAYGHGAEECSPALVSAGARWLGVTSVEEGVRVRGALRAVPDFLQPRILVMCGVWNGEADVAVGHRLTPVIWETYQVALLEAAAAKRGLPPASLPVHIEIDTGMSRQGVDGAAGLQTLLGSFSSGSPLRVEGLMSHLSSSEEVGSPQNPLQMARFSEAVRSSGIKAAWLHIGNTSAVDAHVVTGNLLDLARETGARAMTRAGLALYGYALQLHGGESHVRCRLQPAMTWKTRIISLREIPAGATVGYGATFTADRPMLLALLPVGYADGFRRELSSRGSVLIRGHRAGIVGRVSMDLTVVDVSSIPEAAIGDEAVLFGDALSAEEHADLAHTIVYEILCGISERVPRVMVE